MSKGLKQMVEEAMKDATPALPPVEVSPEAVYALSTHVRRWSGWPNARLIFGDPEGSDYGSCEHLSRTFIVNPETTVLNPHRVLLTVTPFRLRQEAVLTGTLLHEAGHARHTHWKPRTPEQYAVYMASGHGDGTPVTKQEFALASLMEEARIEGLQAQNEERIGAAGLAWTMRAWAAHALPVTALSTDPDQQLMDLLTSWALRAGRQIALYHRLGNYRPRLWVQDFTTLLHTQITEHLLGLGVDSPDSVAKDVIEWLTHMVKHDDDRGSTMIDVAREVLNVLFPETEEDDDGAPMPGTGCQQEPKEEGEQGESDPETGASEGSGEGGQPEEGDQPEGEGGQPEPDGEGDQPEDEEAKPTGGTEGEVPDLGELLREMEGLAKEAEEEQTEEEQDKPPAPVQDGGGAGTSGGPGNEGGWRPPNKDEREIQKGAERFLRELIDVSETSKLTLTESPSATVDGAALSAWKAGGQVRDPHFFQRTKRSSQPSPPIQIAVLVDVSGSMEVLQKPSAILSWALACSALDLRNFAGRGQQIQSTLIHWGSNARVVQKNGEMLPGIREVPCLEGTSAMGEALSLVEEQIPGFFDASDRPVHRLLVQFTDWELHGGWQGDVVPILRKGLAAGVNMLSVVPTTFSERYSHYSDILTLCPEKRGRTVLARYNTMFPESVWEEASKTLVY